MRKAVIFLIRIYQKIVLALNIRVCRFYPSCSEYTAQAVEKYGVIKGILKGMYRILRCNPFNHGGYDPV